MKIKYPIIVEGKYDQIKLSSLVEATIITTGGFEIFNSREKELLIKRLAEKSPIILLTDSDGGGHLIRSHIKTILPPDKIINLYVPQIEGKEKRKKSPSKAGLLGVEGVEKDIILNLLAPFSVDSPIRDRGGITKADLFAYGLSGREDSAKMRQALLKAINLPTTMSCNAMLSAINILYSKTELEEIIKSVK